MLHSRHTDSHLHLHVYLDSIDEVVVKHLLSPIKAIGDKVMATLADVQAALAQAAQDATTEKEEVAVAIQELSDQITALKDQLESGTVVSAEDLDSLVATIQGIDEQVKGITVPVAPV